MIFTFQKLSMKQSINTAKKLTFVFMSSPNGEVNRLPPHKAEKHQGGADQYSEYHSQADNDCFAGTDTCRRSLLTCTTLTFVGKP